MGFFWRHGITALCANPRVVSHQPDIPSTISSPGEKRLFDQKELSLRQFLRARYERVTHEICKEVAARIIFVRLKMRLARAKQRNLGSAGSRPNGK
jgi:hypothetical protein